MLDLDAIVHPYWDRFRADHGDLELFDAHTHIGADDPDGARQTAEQLLAVLARAEARGVVFPLHEPSGYPAANDRVLEAAADSDGRLVAFCRVDPHADPIPEATPLPRRRRQGHQAAPAGRALHAVRARGARDRRARARAARAGADPRRPRDPGARARHGAAVGRVHRRAADPRPRRDLRPRLALARAARAPEPVHRHRVVGPGRPDGAVHARARPPASCGRATRRTGCR